MSFIVVIPARYSSTRLPGKPLLEIAGKPMLDHVVQRARQSRADEVYVATDDERIRRACEISGTPVCMTSSAHQTGTDRIEEVCRQLELDDEKIVVNVQGDEPLMPPSVINQVAENMEKHPAAGICTLYEPISSSHQFQDPNVVKVVTDTQGMALYFSRAMIPFPRDEMKLQENLDLAGLSPGLIKRHVGLYAYRAGVLHQFVQWPVEALEAAEKLEQLRALYNGIRIHVDQACEPIVSGVDTEEDLIMIREIIEIKS
ncbi:MAG: 3-deoxy-manno-octulosonate cytidylyltransferase [Pseudohongiellaceae bacterium]